MFFFFSFSFFFNPYTQRWVKRPLFGKSIPPSNSLEAWSNDSKHDATSQLKQSISWRQSIPLFLIRTMFIRMLRLKFDRKWKHLENITQLQFFKYKKSINFIVIFLKNVLFMIEILIKNILLYILSTLLNSNLNTQAFLD